MTTLVTGSSGFVGTALVPRLRQAGHRVVGVDRRRPAVDGGADAFIHGDLNDPDVLARAFEEDVRLVVHLAAAKDDFGISDEEFFRENVDVTRGLIRAGHARGVRDWIFFSSVATMGLSGAQNDVPADESAPLKPYNAYGSSKMEAEALFTELAASDPEVRALTLRPAIIYGPGNYPYTNMYRLIDGLHRRRFMLVGPGETVKASCYIDNMVDATLFAADRLRPGHEVFVYVDDDPLTAAQIVERVCRLLRRRPPRWYIPVGFARSLAYIADLAAGATGINFPITAARIGQFRTPTNFAARAIRDLGFRQRVNTDEALARTVAWYLEQRTARPTTA